MAGRQLDDWLTAYLQYTDRSEPPLSYHTWVGISMIGAALQRRVYLRWGFDTIFPNMYVVLVGPSGKCRKGTAMNIGKDILKDVGIAMTSESVTREALIRAMRRSMDSFMDPDTGALTYHCSLLAMSDELSVFLGQNDLKFLADLTDWFDAHKEWTYETKGQGTDNLQNVCFSLLGATAPDWITSILPEEAIGGGFTSRIIFIVEHQKGKIVPNPTLTEEEQQLRESLLADLEHIATLAGEMLFSPEAAEWYEAWYEEQERNTLEGHPPITDPTFAGYCERRSTHLRKLAMVLSISRSDERTVEVRDFEKALTLLQHAEEKMPEAFTGLGKSPYSELTDKIMKYIKNSGETRRTTTMFAFYRDVDPQVMKIVEDTLEQMGVVKIILDGGDKIYKWIGDG